MSERDNLVAAVLQAADGEIVGRIRMQKVFYLLEQLGADAGLRFSYYHYGPYSEDVSQALEWAEADSVLEEKKMPTEGGFYSIFRLKTPVAEPPAYLGGLAWERVRNAVALMKRQTSPVLELAATIHWLKCKEGIADWRKELLVRKPSKATEARIAQALALLTDLQVAI
ncbi:MAG: hypothetical protein ACM31D_11815 [Bacteroidota bacterium]